MVLLPQGNSKESPGLISISFSARHFWTGGHQQDVLLTAPNKLKFHNKDTSKSMQTFDLSTYNKSLGYFPLKRFDVISFLLRDSVVSVQFQDKTRLISLKIIQNIRLRKVGNGRLAWV